MTDYSELEPERPEVVVELEIVLDFINKQNFGLAKENLEEMICKYQDNFGLERRRRKSLDRRI